MQPQKEVRMAKPDEHGIERVGAGGQIGEGQTGTPLHHPDKKAHPGVEDDRERVGAGGKIGEGQTGTPLHKPDGK
jgi:hypothetical protein